MPGSRPAVRGKSSGGKGWAIAAATTLGVAVLAFIGLRGTDNKPSSAPVTQATPVLDTPSTKARGDTARLSEPVAGTPLVTGPTGSLLGAFAGTPINDQSVREAQQKEILEMTERAKAGNAEA